jgi:hypothetical protein
MGSIKQVTKDFSFNDLRSFDPFVKLVMDGSHGQVNSTNELLKYVEGVVNTNKSQNCKGCPRLL